MQLGYKGFFSDLEDYTVRASFYSCERDFNIEELYQMFKERLVAELRVESPELLSMAALVDIEEH